MSARILHSLCHIVTLDSLAVIRVEDRGFEFSSVHLNLGVKKYMINLFLGFLNSFKEKQTTHACETGYVTLTL